MNRREFLYGGAPTAMNVAHSGGQGESAKIKLSPFSLAALEELTSADGVRVELTGGVYRSSSHDLIGHAVAHSLSSIFAETVIFGAAAISFTRGEMAMILTRSMRC
jgi:DeoR/GlpR family transcriptional regulator of sugar metabolism